MPCMEDWTGYLDTVETAKALGVKTSRVRRMALDGEIPYRRMRIGSKEFLMFHEDDVEAAKSRRKPGRPPKETEPPKQR